MIGFVYAIGTESGSVVKIGFSENPSARLGDLQVGNPDQLKVHAQWSGTVHLEQILHIAFAHYRVRGEWFDFRELDPVSTIGRMIQLIVRNSYAAAMAPEPANPLPKARKIRKKGPRVSAGERDEQVWLELAKGPTSMSGLAKRINVDKSITRRALQRLEVQHRATQRSDGLWTTT